MPKYHVNDKGAPGVCHATKRPCRFGGIDGKENHYETLADANAAAEKKIEERYGRDFKVASKKKLPESVDFNGDLSHLDSETRANVMVFEAMKRERFCELGKPDISDYYGRGAGVVKQDLVKKLIAVGAIDGKRHGFASAYKDYNIKVREITERGYDLQFVPGSMGYQETTHFNGTFAPSETQAHMNSKAILIGKNGARIMEIDVTCDEDFTTLTEDALKIAQEKTHAAPGSLGKGSLAKDLKKMDRGLEAERGSSGADYSDDYDYYENDYYEDEFAAYENQREADGYDWEEESYFEDDRY